MTQFLRKCLFVVVFGAVVPFLMLEGAFRLLPVASPPPLLPVNAANPVARFVPNRDYLYAAGWNFPIQSHKHSNNYGFNHFADYHAEETTPLLAVVGDSFVEAHEVDAGKSAAELLHAKLAGAGRVYSFGISGAPLSTYLAYAEFARNRFRPQALAIVVIGNDFDESLLKYKSEPRLSYFTDQGELKRVDYEIAPLKKLLRESAFLRYTQHHLLLWAKMDTLKRRLSGVQQSADYEQTLLTRIPDSKKAVDYFLDQLPVRSGLAPTSIVLVLDADRPAIYAEETLARSGSGYFGQMRAYLGAQAQSRGFQVLDLQPAFIARYRRDHQRFEFPTDKHWNETGHRVVAEEIAKSAVYANLFGRRALETAAVHSR
jgi:SGNH hydrolase-like domain, acetyltransferase AlgX